MADRHARRAVKRWTGFIVGAFAILVAALLLARIVGNEYFFFAGYVVLQFIVLATAWNILGGYAGYVNFGSGAFFAAGAYAAVALIKAFAAPLPVDSPLRPMVTGLMGFAVRRDGTCCAFAESSSRLPGVCRNRRDLREPS